MIVGLALSPSLDVTYVVDDLRLGEISLPTRVVRSAGGKTLNASRVAAALGSTVTTVAALGGHTGALVGDLLATSGVRLTAVDTGTETRTCVSIASGTSAGLTELYEPAAPLGVETWAACVAALEDSALAAGDWLLLAGSVPTGVPLGALADLLRDHRARGVHVAVDTHGAALAAMLAARVADLVKVNRSEAIGVLGANPNAAAHVDSSHADSSHADTALGDLALSLAAASGARVVLTDGAAGSFGVDDAVALRVEGDPVVGDFPVGSGDSYFGGLVHSLDAGRSFADAMLTAASCASANALEPGAGILDLERVAAARHRIRVTEVGALS